MIEEYLDEKIKPKEKKTLLIVGVVFAIIILFWGGYSLYKQTSCKNNGGIYMADKTCYFPKDEQERKEILENGYIKTCTGICMDENQFYYFNLT